MDVAAVIIALLLALWLIRVITRPTTPKADGRTEVGLPAEVAELVAKLDRATRTAPALPDRNGFATREGAREEARWYREWVESAMRRRGLLPSGHMLASATYAALEDGRLVDRLDRVTGVIESWRWGLYLKPTPARSPDAGERVYARPTTRAAASRTRAELAEQLQRRAAFKRLSYDAQHALVTAARLFADGEGTLHLELTAHDGTKLRDLNALAYAAHVPPSDLRRALDEAQRARLLDVASPTTSPDDFRRLMEGADEDEPTLMYRLAIS